MTLCLFSALICTIGLSATPTIHRLRRIPTSTRPSLTKALASGHSLPIRTAEPGSMVRHRLISGIKRHSAARWLRNGAYSSAHFSLLTPALPSTSPLDRISTETHFSTEGLELQQTRTGPDWSPPDTDCLIRIQSLVKAYYPETLVADPQSSC